MERMPEILVFVWFLITIILPVALTIYLIIKIRNMRRVPSPVVLVVDFSKGFVEKVPESPISRIMQGPVAQIRDIVEAILRAADDPRVKGIIGRIGTGGLSLASVQELSGAVESFRKSGKPAIAFAESFGESQPANGAYLLATAFDSVHTQPSSEVGLTGLAYESMFVAKLLDKLGVVPRLEARKEYKNAANTFTREAFTEAHREAVRGIIDSLSGQIFDAVVARRGVDAKRLRTLIDRAPLSAQEALEERLVDSIDYWDDVLDGMKTRLGKDVEFLDLVTYHHRTTRRKKSRLQIAYIPVTGMITTGESRGNPLAGGGSSGSATIVRALRDAVGNPKIKAVVLRVGSPGGSYAASDAIAAAVVRTRKEGKPVVVTMGDYAASGGYFISMVANRIFAHPGTITGSIGVVSGKMVVRGLWNRLGVTFDEVHTGDNSLLGLPTHDFTPAQWQQLQSRLDRIYADFVGKTAQARKLTPEEAEEAAKGRIWTGEQAKGRGLVDEFGGIPDALIATRELAKIPRKAAVSVTVLPTRPPLWVRLLNPSAEENRAGARLRFSGVMASLVKQLSAAGGELMSWFDWDERI